MGAESDSWVLRRSTIFLDSGIASLPGDVKRGEGEKRETKKNWSENWSKKGNVLVKTLCLQSRSHQRGFTGWKMLEERTRVIVQDGFADNFVIDLGDELLEGKLDVGVVLGGGLDEIEAVLLAEGSGAVLRDLTQVLQVGLVTNEHNSDVGVGVLAQLGKPPLDVLETKKKKG